MIILDVFFFSLRSLSRHLHSAFKPSVQSVILDGEMIGYDSSAGLRVSKAEHLDVKGLKDGAGGPHPCFYVFDLLYLNGEVLTGKPMKERLQVPCASLSLVLV